MLENKDLYTMLLAVALVMGFIFVVSIAIYFIKEQYPSTESFIKGGLFSTGSRKGKHC